MKYFKDLANFYATYIIVLQAIPFILQRASNIPILLQRLFLQTPYSGLKTVLKIKNQLYRISRCLKFI